MKHDVAFVCVCVCVCVCSVVQGVAEYTHVRLEDLS